LARRILLADDSVTAQNMGRRILTDAGYEVVTVNNGSAALKKIQEQKPDLIVLDVYMPGYGGLEVCQRVKETTRIPVLLTVGKLEPFKAEEARRVKADAFIVKPFEASELLTALTKLEDKIVPQPPAQKPGRFAKTLAALEPVEKADTGEKFGDKETGWKNRLIIPSGSPKTEEAQSEEVPQAAMTTAPATEVAPEARGQESRSAAEPGKEFERPMPAGIPADITQDEIAAISAAAASVDEKAPIEQPSAPSVPPATAVTESATAVASPDVVAEPSLRASSPAETTLGKSEEAAVADVLARAAQASQQDAAKAEPQEDNADVVAAIASLAPAVDAAVPATPEMVSATGPRWVAQPVEVKAEEHSMELHAEMMRAQTSPTNAFESPVSDTSATQPPEALPRIVAEAATAPPAEAAVAPGVIELREQESVVAAGGNGAVPNTTAFAAAAGASEAAGQVATNAAEASSASPKEA